MRIALSYASIEVAELPGDNLRAEVQERQLVDDVEVRQVDPTEKLRSLVAAREHLEKVAALLLLLLVAAAAAEERLASVPDALADVRDGAERDGVALVVVFSGAGQKLYELAPLLLLLLLAAAAAAEESFAGVPDALADMRNGAERDGTAVVLVVLVLSRIQSLSAGRRRNLLAGATSGLVNP